MTRPLHGRRARRAQKLPPIPKGMQRAFYRCKRRGCGRVSYRDYIPYSFSPGILETVCGHGGTAKDYGLKEISEAEFKRRLATRRAA